MKDGVKDVKESKPCRNDHENQYVHADQNGNIWQFCTGCDRKLWVRS